MRLPVRNLPEAPQTYLLCWLVRQVPAVGNFLFVVASTACFGPTPQSWIHKDQKKSADWPWRRVCCEPVSHASVAFPFVFSLGLQFDDGGGAYVEIWMGFRGADPGL